MHTHTPPFCSHFLCILVVLKRKVKIVFFAENLAAVVEKRSIGKILNLSLKCVQEKKAKQKRTQRRLELGIHVHECFSVSHNRKNRKKGKKGP